MQMLSHLSFGDRVALLFALLVVIIGSQSGCGGLPPTGEPEWPAQSPAPVFVEQAPGAPEAVLEDALPTPAPGERILPAVVSENPWPRQMWVDPEPEFETFVSEAARHYWRRLGVRITIAKGGVPIRRAAVLGTVERPLAGQAITSGPWCAFDTCSAEMTARLWISETRERFILQVLEHELGHFVSGWGACTDEDDASGHVPTGGEVMSSPAMTTWGPASVALLCSCGACSAINQDEMTR